MPIANCFVRDELDLAVEIDVLTALWSEGSGIGSEHTTVNAIAGTRQVGVPYRVMAFLYLPTVSSAVKVRHLQVG